MLIVHRHPCSDMKLFLYMLIVQFNLKCAVTRCSCADTVNVVNCLSSLLSSKEVDWMGWKWHVLMNGVFTTKYMATHSLTGGGDKPPLPAKIVDLIVGKKLVYFKSWVKTAVYLQLHLLWSLLFLFNPVIFYLLMYASLYPALRSVAHGCMSYLLLVT